MLFEKKKYVVNGAVMCVVISEKVLLFATKIKYCILIYSH